MKYFSNSPKLALWLLNRFRNKMNHESLFGDYEEMFRLDCEVYGIIYAKIRFWLQVFKTLPSFIKNSILWSVIMFKNYLKISIRNLIKNRMFSLINISGLVIGMTACIFIFLFVRFELSYDNFHKNRKNIYRVRMDTYNEGEHLTKRAKVFGFVAPKLKEKYPEVITTIRMINLFGIMGNFVMSYEDVKFTEEKIFYVDASFFDIFSFDFIQGYPANALINPHSAVITKSISKKYFGDENPIGKSIIMNGDEPFQITGIIGDIPENSHVKFDFLLSFETIKNEEYMLGWADFLTYILLDPQTDPYEFNTKLISSNLVGQFLGNDGMFADDIQLSLQPLKDIHLHSHLEGEAEVNGSAIVTYGLILVGILILIIVMVNYINLTTTRALDRTKEVGIRKVVGAKKSNLIIQFILESITLIVVAFIFSIASVYILLPFFNQIVGKSLSVSLTNLEIWGSFLISFILIGLISNLYPAILLSSFKPVRISKGKHTYQTDKSVIQKTLVVFQFSISIALIAFTVAVYMQHSFMKSKELGINIYQTIIVKRPSITDSTYSNKYSNFKNELLRYTGINGITQSSNIPGRESTFGGSLQKYGDSQGRSIDVDYIGIDYDFPDLYGLNILYGRGFSKDFISDQNAVLLNKKALDLLQYENPEHIINQKIIGFRNRIYNVIGVLENHHQLSLKYEHIPTVYYLRPGTFYSIKFNSDQVTAIINFVKSEYERLFPGNPFEYFFLDDYFFRQYQAELQFSRVFGLFTVLAIFIACLGLFTLSTYTALKRTKEIGIRKVLGATSFHILLSSLKNILKLDLIANLIALPFAWIAIQKWLQNYAFRINMGWEIFVIPTISIIFISLLSVSYQSIKAALANPVDTLKYE